MCVYVCVTDELCECGRTGDSKFWFRITEVYEETNMATITVQVITKFLICYQENAEKSGIELKVDLNMHLRAK